MLVDRMCSIHFIICIFRFFSQIFKHILSFAANDVRRVGYINFPHIRQITLLKDYLDIIALKTSTASQSSSATQKRSNEINRDEPQLTSRSKIFELSNIYDMAKANSIR